jgi:hypothetical protein
VVIDGQQFSLPAFDPFHPCWILALRAMSVTAGNGELSITCIMGSFF